MKRTNITTDNTVFVLLCFEGPDRYSRAGGLGVRVEGLSDTLANMGFPVHLIFIGDPHREGHEERRGGLLILHRWCQWISLYYPQGVYQGESEKLYDFNESAPWFIMESIVKPAVAQDKLVVILGEEWHTAEAMCRLSDLLHANGLSDKVIMFWNANNTFGFDRINWERLDYTTVITTVSKYMKHIMWKLGLNPLVIPNGIHASLLDDVAEDLVARLRNSLEAEVVLSKVARWDPDKRWNVAMEAVARLRAGGTKTVLLARGGIELYGEEVIYNARSLGLTVEIARANGESFEDYFDALERAGSSDIVDLRFHIPQSFLRVMYRASDGVLANSGHEPFGLVGLETMAAGGIAFTGGTGEDYAFPYYNSIVLETPDPQEIEAHLAYLEEHPEEKERIRRAAKETARYFTWEEAAKNLIRKLEYQGRIQGLLAAATKPQALAPEPFEFAEAISEELAPAGRA